MATLQQFGQELLDNMNELVTGTGVDFEELLLRHVFPQIEEEGPQEEPTHCFYKRENMYSEPAELEIKVNGYDLRDEDMTLDLFVVLGYPDQPNARVTPAEANMAFRAVQSFFERSRKGLAQDLEGDGDAQSLAQQIAGLAGLREVNLTLVTNGEVINCDRAAVSVDGIPVRRKVLDLRGLQRLAEPDEILVEFTVGEQLGLPCIQLPQENGIYRSYLAIVPATVLYDLYEVRATRGSWQHAALGTPNSMREVEPGVRFRMASALTPRPQPTPSGANDGDE